MGRTNPTFRRVFDQLVRQWGPYRRALRQPDAERFDAVIEHARRHADACSHANPEDPVTLVLLSVALEQESALDEQQTELENLRERVERLESDDLQD